MSPYRQTAIVKRQESLPGKRWGATRWVRFWVSHRRLEVACFWAIIIFVVIPLRIVLWPFTGDNPLDF